MPRAFSAATRTRVVMGIRTLIIGIGTSLLGMGQVLADDFIVYSPYVIESQNEVELRGYHYADARADHTGGGAEVSIARGVTQWWKTEVYLAKYVKTPESQGRLQGYEFENTFQLTPPGKYVVDLGFLASYERNTVHGVPDAVEFGPLLKRTVGRFAHTANLIWEKQVGAHAQSHYDLRYSYAGTYAASRAFRPGIEAYARPADHAYQAGPIVTGELHLPGANGNLEYRVGVGLGINTDAPRQTWTARLEYEFF